MQQISESQGAQRIFARSLNADFDSGKCDQFINLPLGQLAEPDYSAEGGTCWHLWTTRRYDETKTVPYTRQVSDRARRWERATMHLELAGMGAIVAVVISALLYGIGLTVRWVRRGFGIGVSR